MSKAAKQKAGKALESAVAKIERVLGRNTNVISIEAPARLLDRTTGRLREHDVVITHKVGHDVVKTALECRDRSRKVGVPDIEAFAAKCRDTGIDRAVIVSSLGFAHTALKKARHENVRCYVLRNGGVSPRGQAAGDPFSVSVRTISLFQWISDPSAVNGPIFRDDGSPYDFETEKETYIAHFEGLTHERSKEVTNEVWYPILSDDLYQVDTLTGTKYRIANLRCIVKTEWTETKLKCEETVTTYSDLLNGGDIATASTLTFPDGRTLTITFPKNPTSQPLAQLPASLPPL